MLQSVNARSQGRNLRPKRLQFILWIGHAGNLSHPASQRKAFVAGVLVSLRWESLVLGSFGLCTKKQISPPMDTDLQIRSSSMNLSGPCKSVSSVLSGVRFLSKAFARNYFSGSSCAGDGTDFSPL